MRRVGRFLFTAVKELWSLIVDDGFLAIAALVAIGVAALLSRDEAFGPVNAVGWLLVAMIVGSMLVSLHRAIAARRGPR